MTHAEAQRLLDPHVDNELDLVTALALEEHLGGCPACAAGERRLRELQTFARANLTRHPLPAGLETKLRSALRNEAGPGDAPVDPASVSAIHRGEPAAAPPRRSRRATSWTAFAPAAAAVALLAVLGPRLWPRQPGAGVENAVFSAHVRSLLANHLTDVTSSDQHTVKPWFQGKLDYSVSATDFAAEGFALVGGRLDYLEDTPVAALVYRRGQHVVNHFVWAAARGGDEPVQHLARRGYGARHWTSDGMSHWVVSDLGDADLQAFVALVQRQRG